MSGGQLGALPEPAGGAFEGADVQFLQVLADAAPGVAGGLDDPDSSRASQQRMTWARMRSSSQWWTGRTSRVVFMSRQPRSTCSNCL
jgi:hypothetical protein